MFCKSEIQTMKTNKGLLSFLAAALFLTAAGVTHICAQTTNETFCLQFSGLKEVRRSNQGTLLKELLKAPQTQTVQKILAQRLDEEGLISFFGKGPINTLLDNEIYIQSTGGDEPTFVFAAKVGNDEATKRFAAIRAESPDKGTVTAEKNTVNKEETWERKDEASGLSKGLAHGCGWLIYYTWKGDKVSENIPLDLIHGKRPIPALGTNNLTLRANVEELAKQAGISCPIAQNVSSISLNGWLQGENVKTECRVQLKNEVNFTQSGWQFPTNVINDPLDHLSVFRGASNWVAGQPWWSQIAGKTIAPDQLFLYTYDIPFHTMLVFNTDETTKAVPTLGAGIQQWLTKNYPNMRNPLQQAVNTNKLELGWVGWPILMPTLRGIQDSGRDYVMAATVPALPKGKLLPAETWQAVSSDEDTFFYSWELTGQTLAQWQMQIPLFITELKNVDKNKPKTPKKKKEDMTPEELKEKAQKDAVKKAKEKRTSNVFAWAYITRDRLGNSITKGHQTAPNELFFERMSTCGLSALELWFLCEWLADR